ncbi:alpha/beta fold hydrolase [Richelia sinica]|nr:alpha/beta hydrolase [Richelia sinica]MBD2664145.1 alpha/beta hydrolase [Richelia sinica FACHB-800]
MGFLFRNSRMKLSQGLLFWQEVGEGIPIVFLHGAWHDSSQWVGVMKLLSQHFHCFAPDLLGFGESENPNIHHSIDLQVECLRELLQALKLEKVYLVGNSLGGWIAASYTLKYPEEVYGLVLLAPEGVRVEGEEKFWQKRQRLFNYSQFMVKLLRLLSPVLKLFGWNEKITEDLQLRKTLLEYPTACNLLFNRQQAEIKAELLDNYLGKISVPTLILQGGKDIKNNIDKSNIYARFIPQSNLKIIAHVGDILPDTCSSLVAEDIQDFVKENWL